MRKLLIILLIVAVLAGTMMLPTALASEEGFKGDTIVSDKVETEAEWNRAFEVFTQLNDAYWGVENTRPNVRFTCNFAGVLNEGSYANGVFHDVWPDSVLSEELVYNDVYYSAEKLGFGYQYGDGEVVEFYTKATDMPPIIIIVIDMLNLADMEAWNKDSYGEYDYDARGYVKAGAPTVRFKDGKVVNLMMKLGGGATDDDKYLFEINIEYDTAVVPLPTELLFLREQGGLQETINSTFGSIDYNVANFMNKISRSFLGGIATFLAKAVSLITEKGLIFFLIAIIMMCFVRTRKAGVLMFVAVAIGTIFTNFVLKDFIMRTRPYETNTIYYNFWKAVDAPLESSYSFPSGHTTAIMAAAVAFFVSFRKRYSWVGIFAVLAVGVSRIYLMAHYTSDVVAAVLVGGIAGVLAVYVTKLLFYIIEHYAETDICKAILTRDVSEMFKKKQKATPAPVAVTSAPAPVTPVAVEQVVPAPVAVVETEEVEEEKEATVSENWAQSLIALMTEVRDLLKENKSQDKVEEKVDEIAKTVEEKTDAE